MPFQEVWSSLTTGWCRATKGTRKNRVQAGARRTRPGRGRMGNRCPLEVVVEWTAVSGCVRPVPEDAAPGRRGASPEAPELVEGRASHAAIGGSLRRTSGRAACTRPAPGSCGGIDEPALVRCEPALGLPLALTGVLSSVCLGLLSIGLTTPCLCSPSRHNPRSGVLPSSF